MKTQGKVWIIYNSDTKVQTKPMSVIQAQVFLLTLSIKDQEKLFLWTPGWEKWICIRDFLTSEQRYFVLAQPPKPQVKEETFTQTKTTPATTSESPYTEVLSDDAPAKNQDAAGFWAQDFNGDELDLSKIRKIKPSKIPLEKPTKETKKETAGSDRRRDPRHNFKIEVVLVSKARSFRTYSKNISLSGTMLENEIPRDFLNAHFDLIIVNPFEGDPSKARLLFRAKIVGDVKDPRRLMFIEQDPAMTVRLDALLKAYVSYQEQVRKSVG